MKKKYIKWIVLAVVVVAAVVGIVYGMSKKNTKVKVEQPKDYVEPGYGNLKIEEIAGFHTVQSNQGADSQIKLSDPGLVLEAVGKYSGPFIEDGSDEPIVDGLAIIVTNQSSEMVQVADITLNVNGSEKANFLVTNLPGGTSTMVLERGKRTYQEGDTFAFDDMQAGYLKETSLMEDTFEIKGEDGKLTVKNISKKDYKSAYIYYKYTQRGGAFLGGITYRVPVEDIKAGKTVEVVAGHWREGSSRLSMVEAVE